MNSAPLHPVGSDRPRLVRRPVADHSPAEARALCALVDTVWPSPDGSVAKHLESFHGRWAAEGREVFAVWAGDVPRAMAMIFGRDIRTADGPLRVMALAVVCSDPVHRGEGWGRLVARAALDEVRPGGFSVSLFQTGIPAFYEKLGSRTIDNGFINSTFRPGDRGSADQPWWNPFVMIHPAGFPWPSGTVDLLGPGY